jgi:hypothetical protein
MRRWRVLPFLAQAVLEQGKEEESPERQQSPNYAKQRKKIFQDYATERNRLLVNYAQ